MKTNKTNKVFDYSTENYLRWVIELCNQEYNGNITELNDAMIGFIKSYWAY